LSVVRHYQIQSLCGWLGCNISTFDQMKLWTHSIRDLYGFFSNLLKDPDRRVNLSNLPQLAYEVNQVRQLKLVNLMMANRYGRTMVVGTFNSDTVRNVEFLENLARIPNNELQSRRVYDSMYVFSQSYLFDLKMLRRVILIFLKLGGVCRLRVVTATNETILWNYAMECALQGQVVDNFMFRDLRVYSEYFSKDFDVEIARVSSVGDYFVQLRWKTTSIEMLSNELSSLVVGADV